MEDAPITAVGVAASLAAGFSPKVGVGLSGAGAQATNTILTTTNAYIDGSRISSASDVTLDATNTSTITATIVGASLAIGIGTGSGGAAVSIGVALASN